MHAVSAFGQAVSLVRNDHVSRYVAWQRAGDYTVIPLNMIKEYRSDARRLRVIWCSEGNGLFIREYHGFLAEVTRQTFATQPEVALTVPITVSQPQRQLRKIYLGKASR